MVVHGYTSEMESIGRRIRIARESAKVSQQRLADALGIKRESVANWESDKTKPDLGRMPQIAFELDARLEWLMTGEGLGPEDRARRQAIKQVDIVPGSQLVSAGRMPVYAAAQGGDGHVIVSFDQVDSVKTPAELENVRGGYGLLIAGESMVPAFWPGDMALVNPHLQPARMKNVILYHTPPNGGDVEAIVKQLNGWTDKEWVLQQYNPMQEFREFRAEWPICHRVVGRYDAR